MKTDRQEFWEAIIGFVMSGALIVGLAILMLMVG